MDVTFGTLNLCCLPAAAICALCDRLCANRRQVAEDDDDWQPTAAAERLEWTLPLRQDEYGYLQRGS